MKEYIARYRKSDRRYQTLESHLLETAKLTANSANKIYMGEIGRILGLLHDAGKATDLFYNYLRSSVGDIRPGHTDYIDPEANKGQIDHATAGAQIINESKINNLLSQIMELVIMSHHTGIIDVISPDGINKYQNRITKPDTRLEEAKKNLPHSINEELGQISQELIFNQFNAQNKKLLDGRESTDIYHFQIGLLIRFLLSCLLDADRTDAACENPDRATSEKIPWGILIDKLEKSLPTPTLDIDYIRQDISEKCLTAAYRTQGIYQLTVPTGGGKTLSSLRFALHHAQEYKLDHIYYIVPFTTIIDQNASKIRDILGAETLLEHHSNLTPEHETELQQILSENWDTQIIFTTMVQFLETLFSNGTKSARRMHQLANSVIIFDEIQALPLKCVCMFNTAIKFLVNICGSTALLCTATQPLLDNVPVSIKVPGKDECYPYSLTIPPENRIIKDVSGLFTKLNRVEVINIQHKLSNIEIAGIIKEESQVNSVLAIVNTKKSALNLYAEVKSLELGLPIYHLSTNMCPEHRMEVLNKVKTLLEKNHPVICISTQLIEAGVDIDFGCVIRYKAGLDSIIQAAGRCNRHNKKRGRLIIVESLEENLGTLSEIINGIKCTKQVMYEYEKNPDQFDNNLLGDKAIACYYDFYYYQNSNTMLYPVDEKSGIGREDSLFELLSTNRRSINDPHLLLKQSFASANKEFKVINNDTQGVIVPYEKGYDIINNLKTEKDLKKQKDLLKEAQRYSVNLYKSEIGKYNIEMVPDSNILYISSGYDLDYGVTTNMETLIT